MSRTETAYIHFNFKNCDTEVKTITVGFAHSCKKPSVLLCSIISSVTLFALNVSRRLVVGIKGREPINATWHSLKEKQDTFFVIKL